MVWTDLHQELYLIVSELLNEGKIFRNDIDRVKKKNRNLGGKRSVS